MYYEKTLSEPLLEMYLGDLADLPEAEVIVAYQAYRRDPKQRGFPLPSQIRSIVRPEISDDTLAREAAARIPEAIRMFGYASPKEAQFFIGDAGWSVVRRFGGWEYICENHGLNLNPSTFLAQARDLAKAHIELSKAGRLGEAPSLPSPGGLVRLGGAFPEPVGLQAPKTLAEILKEEGLL